MATWLAWFALQTLKAAAEKGKQAVGFGSEKVLKKSQNVFKVC